MKTSKLLLIIVILLSVSFVLTACGGSQPAPEKEPAATEEPAQQPEPTSSGPPSPPHPIDGANEKCLDCHNTDSPVNKPSPHPERGEENCTSCHQPAN